MDDDPYSLNRLKDIVVPDPPPFWPPAPGLWVALVVGALVVLLAVWQWRAARNRNAYRKAGLDLLSEAKTAHDVAVAMKRVALAAFPRETVASLYGDDWAAFLHKTCPRDVFSTLTTTDPGAETNQDLINLARTWIRHHRVPDGQSPAPAQ